MFSNRGVKSVSAMMLAVATVFLSPVSAMADEPAQLIEEVTVVGAVRGSASLTIADIDVAGDENLEEMPAIYE
jgi:hypothetical protein